MQIGGASYLVPVDMIVASEQSVPLRAYPLKHLVERVSAGRSAVNVVVLDACRDNPFVPAPAVRYRSFAGLGLAPVQTPRGTVVAYSTQPGQLAADGPGENSHYAAALASVMLEPHLRLEDVFKKVNTLVRNKTKDDQIPWFESSLTQEYFFIPPEGITLRPTTGASRSSVNRDYAHVSRGSAPYQAAIPSTPELWYREMTYNQWSTADWEIQQAVKQVTHKSLAKLKHQAGSGHVVALTVLGLAHLGPEAAGLPAGWARPSGVMPNKAAALKWLGQASERGFPVAQAVLGELYFEGKLVRRDLEEALRLTQAAAQANYFRAQLNLAQMMATAQAGPDPLARAAGAEPPKPTTPRSPQTSSR
jgi:hypothetical protein